MSCLCTWSVIQKCVYENKVPDINKRQAATVSTTCVAWLGAVAHWWRRPMADMLVLMPVANILNVLCDYQFVSSVHNELYFTSCFTQWVVHYNSTKFDVSFSPRSKNTLFRDRWTVFHVCVQNFFLLTMVQKLFFFINRSRYSRVMITYVLPPFSWFTMYVIVKYIMSSEKPFALVHVEQWYPPDMWTAT